jgi:isoamylase
VTTRDHPLGATCLPDGVCFRVFSSVAERIELCVFGSPGGLATYEMQVEPGGLWQAHVADAAAGTAYGFRVHGPYDPSRGLRCDPSKLLVDPYAKAVSRQRAWGQAMFSYRLGSDGTERDTTDSAGNAPCAFVVDDVFDWSGETRPCHSPARTVLYELHVKGFTQRHAGVPPELRGTYAGLAHPAAIDAITRLGATTVELMPVQQFGHDAHLTSQGRRNYWGYQPYAYFAPHAEYASTDRGGQVHEFKAMVKALHEARLEVVIDVVYNHTAEGNHLGPTISFRGFDNPAYYHLVPDDPQHYMDYTGTGNSLNLRHPSTLQLVMDSLRYWVQEMHVDGFRFDLATTLARAPGTVDTWAAFFGTIHQDPVLQRVKLIAEPWDVGDNGYQVGNFPFHWSEWNDRFRETVRACWSTGCDNGELARRITGSPDLFQHTARPPTASVNYVCSHDGLTLHDLVVAQLPAPEGAEADEVLLAARARRHRNLLATLMLSVGTPMLSAGDEWGRSQQGCDNAYDQDNELSWLDWGSRDDGLAAFTTRLIQLRRALPWLRDDRWVAPGVELQWRRPDGNALTDEDWAAAPPLLGLHAARDGVEALWLINTTAADVTYQLPTVAGGWHVALDTANTGCRCHTGAAESWPLGSHRAVVLMAGEGAAG